MCLLVNVVFNSDSKTFSRLVKLWIVSSLARLLLVIWPPVGDVSVLVSTYFVYQNNGHAWGVWNLHSRPSKSNAWRNFEFPKEQGELLKTNWYVKYVGPNSHTKSQSPNENWWAPFVFKKAHGWLLFTISVSSHNDSGDNGNWPLWRKMSRKNLKLDWHTSSTTGTLWALESEQRWDVLSKKAIRQRNMHLNKELRRFIHEMFPLLKDLELDGQPSYCYEVHWLEPSPVMLFFHYICPPGNNALLPVPTVRSKNCHKQSGSYKHICYNFFTIKAILLWSSITRNVVFSPAVTKQ